MYLPRDNFSFAHQHLVPSESSREGDNLAFYDARKTNPGSSGLKSSSHNTSWRRFGDPSVITGSFVYQPTDMPQSFGGEPRSDYSPSSPSYSAKQSGGYGGLGGFGSSMAHADESVPSLWHKKPTACLSQDNGNNIHYRKASLSEFYLHAQNSDLNSQNQRFGAGRKRFNSNTSNNNEFITDFTGRSQISSIPIPTYTDMEKLHESQLYQVMSSPRPGSLYFNATTRRKSKRNGRITKHRQQQRSRVAGHCYVHSAGARNNTADPGKFYQPDLHQHHHYQHHQHHEQQHEYIMPVTNNTFRGNPDLLSTHDLFVRIHNATKTSSSQPQNVTPAHSNGVANYTEVTADYDASDTYSAATMHYDSSISSDNSDNSNHSSETGRNFIKATDRKGRMSSELSYDSFRNEHLRDLSRQGPASSSTLDNGFRYLMAGDIASSSSKKQPE